MFKNMSRKRKIITGVTIMAVLGAGGAFTGAYFSAHDSGVVTMTLGNVDIKITDGAVATFDNVLPGEAKTATITYENTGKTPEDVWLTFPNAAELAALNSLGHYGALTIKSGDTVVFNSTNLSNCGSGDCKPLTNKVKIADNVAAGTSGTITSTFTLGAQLTDQSAAGIPITAHYDVWGTQDGQEPTL